jgi:hypothetical protein
MDQNILAYFWLIFLHDTCGLYGFEIYILRSKVVCLFVQASVFVQAKSH